MGVRSLALTARLKVAVTALVVVAVLLLASGGADAQTRPTIAVVLSNTPMADLTSPQPRDRYARAFLEGMRKLGWVDGQNMAIIWMSAEGHPDRYDAVAQDLVTRNVDLIVASGAIGLTMLEVTSVIPIVMISGGSDPGWGVQSLARPGGNLTGLTTAVDPVKFAEKQLQLLKETVPKISRVAYLSDSGTAAAPEAAARTLKVALVPVAVDGPGGLPKALDAIARQKVDAIFVAYGRFFWAQRSTIIDFAARHRLPAMYPFDVFARDGGLMSYGVDFVDLFKRSATYVDKILKGAKPGDLPLEQPVKYQLFINLKTAKALGLTIPKTILLRADQTIQ